MTAAARVTTRMRWTRRDRTGNNMNNAIHLEPFKCDRPCGDPPPRVPCYGDSDNEDAALFGLEHMRKSKNGAPRCCLNQRLGSPEYRHPLKTVLPECGRVAPQNARGHGLPRCGCLTDRGHGPAGEAQRAARGPEAPRLHYYTQAIEGHPPKNAHGHDLLE